MITKKIVKAYSEIIQSRVLVIALWFTRNEHIPDSLHRGEPVERIMQEGGQEQSRDCGFVRIL